MEDIKEGYTVHKGLLVTNHMWRKWTEVEGKSEGWEQRLYKFKNGYGASVNMTPKKYLTISQAYIDACDEINKREGTSYLPYQIQAITWVAWRRIHGIT